MPAGKVVLEDGSWVGTVLQQMQPVTGDVAHIRRGQGGS